MHRLYKCSGIAGLVSFLICISWKLHAQESVMLRLDTGKSFQTIHNFSASDAWAGQFVGNWPDNKKNAMADWLFSLDTLPDGSPKGIGLTMWRYNIGAGSAAQGDASGIGDEWRRAASLNDKDDISKQRIQSQNWWLRAAKERGVQQYLGFFNSPPVSITKNGKGYADKGLCNIDGKQYESFAQYAVKAIKSIRKSTGIAFDYISPVNEPQWDWSDGGQEGCPYTNQEIYGVVKSFDKVFTKRGLITKLLITESGDLRFLLPANDKPEKDNQVADFFDPASGLYTGGLQHVAPVIAGHSYFSSSPQTYAIDLRRKIGEAVKKTGQLDYWQSEYCILGNNAGEIDGGGRDTGMRSALYVAKLIWYDLVAANAAAWQWWLAISAYNYKDGLIYIEKNKTDGWYSDSKIMWALGNYSRFIRPGMQRVTVDYNNDQVYISAFKDPSSKKLVIVLVNPATTGITVEMPDVLLKGYKSFSKYTTSASQKLKKENVTTGSLTIAEECIVTVVLER